MQQSSETLQNEINSSDLKNALMGYLDRPVCKGNEIYSLCPIHEETRRSFSANFVKGVYNCFSCGARGKIKSLNLSSELKGSGYSATKPLPKSTKVIDFRPMSDFKIIYDFRHGNGNLSFQKLKAEPTAKHNYKEFRYRHKSGHSWVYKMPENPVNIYKLPEIMTSDSRFIYIVEGEKDVESLIKNGMLATTHRLGANSARWNEKDIKLLRGKDVIFIPDCDKPGINYAKNAITDFAGYDNFKLLHLGYNIADKHGKDVSDFIQERGFNEFNRLVPMDVTEFTLKFGNGFAGDSLPVDIHTDNPDKLQPRIDELKEKVTAIKSEPENFWYYTDKKECKIDRVKFTDYLNLSGHGKIFINSKDVSFVRNNKSIIQDTSRAAIKDFVRSKINNENDYKTILSSLMKASNVLFSDQQLEYLQTIKLNPAPKQKNTAYLYYKNCVVKVTKNTIETINYNDFNYHIWENQVIQRNFRNVKWNDFEFSHFCLNVSGEDTNRLHSMMTGLGYLMHKYNDPSNMRCVILIDEKAKNAGDRKGRTGKGLTEKALGYIRNLVPIDSKKLDNRFAFQKINLDTEIINFNDIPLTFDLTNVYREITDNLSVEKKGGIEFTIPQEDIPKIVISSNHVIKGIEQSDIGRRFDIYYSDYYDGVNRTPAKEFKRNFFTDWNDQDWNKFDSFMVSCIQHYLATGLIPYESDDIKYNKLVAETCQEFVDFMKDAFEDGVKTEITEYEPDGRTYKRTETFKIEKVRNDKDDSKRYYKNDLFNTFKRFYYPNFENMTRSNTFSKWVEIYTKTYNIKVKENASCGLRYYTFFD